MILRTDGVTKRFGGLTAVNKVTLRVEEGQIHSIIGPNGAGKTTLFNMLTGEIPVSDGEIYFREKKVTGLKPYQIAKARIGRSFQQNKLFGNLTVLENVRLAEHAHHRGHFNFTRHFLSFTEPVEKAWQVLEELGITDIAAKQAGELPHGQQRTLEVALALAADPLLLLLDEPTSGMSPDDSVRMVRLLRKIGKRLTMLVIEHNMNLVMSISSVITVLQQGTVIACGKPSEVEKDKEVRKAYLGGHV
ncbi:MAG: ABC transporter ATP-binding protein [Desulfobacterales bacterium]|nr:ABC transporter ATP-binding protein [Desulfobacterales bacterium]MBL7172635.1 ABC transporter ATP-binding protein [Desulfobacteraceae bacterium]MBU0732727.1 ABC transporter ATP-binding protein [Pseudomonadota bacterium]